jgi:hypothetical protein
MNDFLVPGACRGVDDTGFQMSQNVRASHGALEMRAKTYRALTMMLFEWGKQDGTRQ